jgi:hypothetical protein
MNDRPLPTYVRQIKWRSRVRHIFQQLSKKRLMLLRADSVERVNDEIPKVASSRQRIHPALRVRSHLLMQEFKRRVIHSQEVGEQQQQRTAGVSFHSRKRSHQRCFPQIQSVPSSIKTFE